MFKRFISVTLAVILLMTFSVPAFVYADENYVAPVESDYAPENLLPVMHIYTPSSPFVDRELWQNGSVSLTGAPEGEYNFDEVGARIRGRGNSTWWAGPDKRPLRFRFSALYVSYFPLCHCFGALFIRFSPVVFRLFALL